MVIFNFFKTIFYLFKLRSKEIANNIFQNSKLKDKIPQKAFNYFVPTFFVIVFCFAIILPNVIYAIDTAMSSTAVNVSSCYDTFLKDSAELDFDHTVSFDQNGVEAYGIYVNKMFICAIENPIDADFLFNSLIIMCNNNLSVSNSAFKEDICTVKGYYNQADILSYEDFKNLLLSEKGDTISYRVKSSDTLTSICALFSVTDKSLKELNIIDLNCLKPGDIINIKLTKPILSLCANRTETYSKSIPYKTKYTKDKTLAKGRRICIVKGEKGEKVITDKVSYINNDEVARKNISIKIKKKPVTKVVCIGTHVKPKPKKKKPKVQPANTDVTDSEPSSDQTGEATGQFMWPVPSTTSVTSGFGSRWGAMHNGLDISSGGCYGQDIVAADGGTVTCASDTGDGYGIHIIIDHGNGYQTLYGHASQACVSVGAHVSKGQVIAKIGSTGNSTGPHCHFEIISNSTHLDPASFF